MRPFPDRLGVKAGDSWSWPEAMEVEDNITVAMPASESRNKRAASEQTESSESSLPSPPYANNGNFPRMLRPKKRILSTPSEASSDNIVVAMRKNTKQEPKTFAPFKGSRSSSSASSRVFEESQGRASRSEDEESLFISSDTGIVCLGSSSVLEGGDNKYAESTSSTSMSENVSLLELSNSEASTSPELVDTPMTHPEPVKPPHPAGQSPTMLFHHFSKAQGQASTNSPQPDVALPRLPPSQTATCPPSPPVKRKTPPCPFQECSSSDEEDNPPPRKKPELYEPLLDEARRAEKLREKALMWEEALMRKMARRPKSTSSQTSVNQSALQQPTPANTYRQPSAPYPSPAPMPARLKRAAESSPAFIPRKRREQSNPAFTFTRVTSPQTHSTALHQPWPKTDELKSTATQAQAVNKSNDRPSSCIPAQVTAHHSTAPRQARLRTDEPKAMTTLAQAANMLKGGSSSRVSAQVSAPGPPRTKHVHITKEPLNSIIAAATKYTVSQPRPKSSQQHAPLPTKQVHLTKEPLNSIIAAASKQSVCQPRPKSSQQHARPPTKQVNIAKEPLNSIIAATTKRNVSQPRPTSSQQHLAPKNNGSIPPKPQVPTTEEDFAERQQRIRRENSRRQLDAMRAKLKEADLQAQQEERAIEKAKIMEAKHRAKSEELAKEAAKQARKDTARHNEVATSGANMTSLNGQRGVCHLSLPGRPEGINGTSLHKASRSDEDHCPQPISLMKKHQQLERDSHSMCASQGQKCPQPVSISEKLQGLVGNSRARAMGERIASHGHASKNSQQHELDYAWYHLASAEREALNQQQRSLSSERHSSHESVDRDAERQRYVSITKRFTGISSHIKAKDIAKTVQQQPLSAEEPSWAISQPPRDSNVFRIHKPPASSTFSDVRNQASNYQRTNTTRERKLGAITVADIHLVKWRDAGIQWQHIPLMFQRVTGISRKQSTLNRRAAMVMKAIDISEVTPELLKRVLNNEEDAIRRLNFLVHGDDFELDATTQVQRSQRSLFDNPQNDGSTASKEKPQLPVMALRSGIPSRPNSDSTMAASPVRSPVAVKTLGDEAIQAYYASMIEEVAEELLGDTEDESEREDSPFTEADKVHYAFKTERRQLLEKDDTDCEIDDLPWIQIGGTYESKTKAKIAANEAITMSTNTTDAVIAPDVNWTIQQIANTGDEDIVVAYIAASDIGEVQVRVRRFLRTYQMGRFPKNKDGWLPKTVYFVKEKITTTEGDGTFEEVRTTVETTLLENSAFGALGAANTHAGDRILELVVRPRTTNLRQFDLDKAQAKAEMQTRIEKLEERGELFQDRIEGEEERGLGVVVEIWVERGTLKGPRNL